MARKLTEEWAIAKIRLPLQLTDWAADDLGDAIWPDTYWPWEIMLRRGNGPNELDMALWHDRALVGLCIATTIGDRVIIRFVEGSPSCDERLKGKRLALFVDAAAKYGDLLGSKEVWLHTDRPKVIKLCVELLGFERTDDGHLRLRLRG